MLGLYYSRLKKAPEIFNLERIVSGEFVTKHAYVTSTRFTMIVQMVCVKANFDIGVRLDQANFSIKIVFVVEVEVVVVGFSVC